MYNRYDFVGQTAQKVGNSQVADISNNYFKLYQARYRFIKYFDVREIYTFYQLREYYNGVRALWSDVVYALRLHNIVGAIVTKFRR